MIEFGVKRASNGRRTRIKRKFPRKEILHRGDEKLCNWYPDNWDDDNYPYFHGNLTKFLMSNIGRPVDKVFSKFLSRCKKSALRYNLKQEFYDMFEKKEDIDYTGGFYLTNGIINYKKRSNPPYPKRPVSISDLNRELLPRNLNILCKRCVETHLPQLLGKFWLDCESKREVFIIEREVFDTGWMFDVRTYRAISNYRRCFVWGLGSGVNERSWTSQDKAYPRVTYELNGTYASIYDNPDIVFITKIK